MLLSQTIIQFPEKTTKGMRRTIDRTRPAFLTDSGIDFIPDLGSIAARSRTQMAPNATDYALRELQRAKSKCPEWLYALDFSDFLHQHPIDELDLVFPKLKNGGGLDPPPQYLSSGYKLVEWRQLSEQEQQQQWALAYGGPVANAEGRQLPPPGYMSDVHVASFFSAMALLQRPRVHQCHGITRQLIEGSRVEDKEEVLVGFNKLVANAFRYMASYISHHGIWPYGGDVKGFLIECGSGECSWVCVELPSTVSPFPVYGFRRIDCNRSNVLANGSCGNCRHACKYLFQKCRNEMDWLKKSPGTLSSRAHTKNLTYVSPSITVPIIKEKSKTIHKLRMSLGRSHKLITRLRDNQREMPSLDAKGLFGLKKKEYEKVYHEMMKKKTVSEKEVMDVLFIEFELVRQRVEIHGNAKGHTFSPLVVRFAMMLRSKMTKSNYEFVRKLLGIPTNCTLTKYGNADTTSPDGPMLETIVQHAQELLERSIPFDSPQRKMKLSFDSHTVKNMLGEFGWMYSAYIYLMAIVVYTNNCIFIPQNSVPTLAPLLVLPTMPLKGMSSWMR